MKMGIRAKLIFYIFFTIIVTFIIFGVWLLSNEKKQWEAYHLDRTLSFTSFTSNEVIKLFGRDVKSQEAGSAFDKNVRKLLQFNKDLVKFLILNVNGTTLYDSEFYDDFLTPQDRDEIEKLIKESATASTNSTQSYKITTLSSGKKVVDVITPIVHLTGRHILNVRYIVSYNSVENEFKKIKIDFYIITAFALCFSFLLLLVISKKITNPVYVLTGMVKKMRSGDFNAFVQSPTNDEIGELSIAFNEMVGAIKADTQAIEKKNEELLHANAELKELQEQLIRSERLAAIGQLATGVSHEIDNPIGIILGYAELIKSELSADSPLQTELDNIINESKRCRRIVGGLLNFAKPSPTLMEELNLNSLTRETVSAVSLQSLFKRINIKEEYDEKTPIIMLDRDKMKQVLINLLINAAQAIKIKGEITIQTKLIKKDGKQFLTLSIKDTGIGIAQENLSKIFAPFFTTKSHGQGTGLGLSISQKLVQEQNGVITVISQVNEGTTFTITFPVV